jgi:hypothetical protein
VSNLANKTQRDGLNVFDAAAEVGEALSIGSVLQQGVP